MYAPLLLLILILLLLLLLSLWHAFIYLCLWFLNNDFFRKHCMIDVLVMLLTKVLNLFLNSVWPWYSSLWWGPYDKKYKGWHYPSFETSEDPKEGCIDWITIAEQSNGILLCKQLSFKYWSPVYGSCIYVRSYGDSLFLCEE